MVSTGSGFITVLLFLGLLWFPVIPAEGYLIDVALHMLFADPVEDAILRTLKERVERFGRIAVNLISGEFITAKVERMSILHLSLQLIYMPGSIGHEVGILIHMTLNMGVGCPLCWHCQSVRILRPWRSTITRMPCFFVTLPSIWTTPFSFWGLPPRNTFVDHDDTAERGEILIAHVHHLANRVAELPGRLLCHRAMNTEETPVLEWTM